MGSKLSRIQIVYDSNHKTQWQGLANSAPVSGYRGEA